MIQQSRVKVIGKKGQNNRSVLYSCHLIIHCPFITQWYLSPLCISYLQSTVRAFDAKMPFSGEQFRLIGVVLCFYVAETGWSALWRGRAVSRAQLETLLFDIRVAAWSLHGYGQL